MPVRKTSTSTSLDNFLSDSDGKKVTKSPGRSRKTAQSKSKKQTPKKTTTTPKAKAKSTKSTTKSSKTSTKSTTTTSKRAVKKTTSTPRKRTVRGAAKKTSSDSIKKTATTKRVTKKPVQTKKPVTKKPTKRKPRNPEPFNWTKSRTKKLFPWVETFPVALEDHKENKKCWFVCLEHAEKYVVRYKMYKQDYKCIVYYKSDSAK